MMCGVNGYGKRWRQVRFWRIAPMFRILVLSLRQRCRSPQQLACVLRRAALAPAMIVLHTLGAVAIRVGARNVLPSAARAFGALFFLTLERGRAVPRGELQSLLFPDQRDRAGAHNLRQLLYRVRNLGAPVAAVDAGIVLAPDDVRDDYSMLCESQAVTPGAVRAVTEGILPGYAPTFSRPYTEWVERQRARIQNAVLQRLASELAEMRTAGRWREVEPIARACLALDPLNEEATLALAETMALNGQKANAVRLLDGYIEDVGPYGKDLRVPAHVLRTRISENVPNDGFPKLGAGPFVGRDAEMAELWRRYRAAKQGEPGAVVIYGEAGIGKTRLGTEFLKAAALDGATCLKAECAAHDIQRPLGVFVDLVPKLLASPGGLGVAPSAMRELQRLTQPDSSPDRSGVDADPQHRFNVIVGAVTDLVDAVSEELPVAILVDDAHFMDPASASLIFALVAGGRSRRCAFALTARAKAALGEGPAEPDAVSWLRLRPLDEDSSRNLFSSLAGTLMPDADSVAATDRLALAAGNPLFLRSLLLELPTAPRNALPVSLTDLLTQRVQRLTDATLRAFVAAVLLGKHCRLDRLTRLAGLSEGELLTAIQTLENQGFLQADGVDIRSAHPLLSQTALAQFPPVTMRLMHSTAAMMLEAEAEPGHNIGMLWDAAEHWHHAGATDKAIELLQSCAEYCVRIGRPEIACELLQRAVVLTSGEEQHGVVLRLIETARTAEDYELVTRAVSQYRALTATSSNAPIHDELELIGIQAERLSGTSLVQLAPRLRECITHPTSNSSHRLRAACYLLAAHDLDLDRDAASAVYALATKIERKTPIDELNRWIADLLFHSFAGECAVAQAAARQLLAHAPAAGSASAEVRILVDAAMGLYRAADMPAGIVAMERAFELGKALGMMSSMLDSSSMLAWMYHTTRDFSAADRWDRTSDRLYARVSATGETAIGRAGHYLSNKIEFALEQGDAGAAEAWLERARKRYAEIDTPRSRILAHAFSLRINQMSDPDRRQSVDLNALAQQHEMARECGLHDNFVDAYWHALALAGHIDDANHMLLEYLKVRRDGFPPLRPIASIVASQGMDHVFADHHGTCDNTQT